PHLRSGRRIVPTQQQHAAVELPARHEHVSPRCSRALVEGAIVVSRVDQNPGVECSRLPPGVPAEPDDRCYGFHQQSLADREKGSRADARARRGRGRRGNGETPLGASCSDAGYFFCPWRPANYAANEGPVKKKVAVRAGRATYAGSPRASTPGPDTRVPAGGQAATRPPPSTCDRDGGGTSRPPTRTRGAGGGSGGGRPPPRG